MSLFAQGLSTLIHKSLEWAWSWYRNPEEVGVRILFLFMSLQHSVPVCLSLPDSLQASCLSESRQRNSWYSYLECNIEAIPLKVKISSQMRSKTTVFCLGKECGAGGGSIDKSHVGEISRELYTSLRLSWRLTSAMAYSSLIPFPLCDQGLLGFEFWMPALIVRLYYFIFIYPCIHLKN